MSQNANAPKVEETRINALVASLTYNTAHVPDTTSTMATARLPGGFVVAIGHSACVSPEVFSAELGRKYAIENAEGKARDALWQFEGYALYLDLEKVRAAGVGHMPAHQQRVVLEQIELRDKAEKLNKFFSTGTFNSLPLDERTRLRNQLVAMYAYADILAERINAFPVVTA